MVGQSDVIINGMPLLVEKISFMLGFVAEFSIFFSVIPDIIDLSDLTRSLTVTLAIKIIIFQTPYRQLFY